MDRAAERMQIFFIVTAMVTLGQRGFQNMVTAQSNTSTTNTVQNIALNKPTQATHPYKQSVSSSAVDGSRIQQYDSPADSCYHSILNVTSAFWTVDLGKIHHLYNITIFGRVHDWGSVRFNRSMVFVSNDTGLHGEICFVANGQADSIYNFICDKWGRYLTVFTNVTSTFRFDYAPILEICEVEIYECIPGRFGPLCQQQCYCQQGTCDHVTGLFCPGGCAGGYTGPTCSQENRNATPTTTSTTTKMQYPTTTPTTTSTTTKMQYPTTSPTTTSTTTRIQSTKTTPTITSTTTRTQYPSTTPTTSSSTTKIQYPTNGNCSLPRSGPTCSKVNFALAGGIKYIGKGNDVLITKLIDGNNNHSFCISLIGEGIIIDLQEIREIRDVKISGKVVGQWNPNEELFKVNVVSPLNNELLPCAVSGNMSIKSTDVITVSCDLSGQYVTLQEKEPKTKSPSNAFFDICTIEVYGCSAGTFGKECSQECYCKQGTCNSVTGLGCPGGCKDGYVGETCSGH